MPFKPGDPKPANGGRKAGTPNRSTMEAREIAERLGVNPLEVLLLFAKGDEATLNVQGISPELRQKSAKDACEYLFPKLKSIEHTGQDGADLFLNILSKLNANNT